MYPDWVWQVLVFGTGIWFLCLTFLILRQGQFLKSLFPKSEGRDIRKKFEDVVNSTLEFDKKILDIGKRLDLMKEDSLKHIQKVNLIRYNPYEDTGGDQSFTACFLDKFGTGFVITSLHTRSGTRVFAKLVVRGEGLKHQLSKEEQEAITAVI